VTVEAGCSEILERGDVVVPVERRIEMDAGRLPGAVFVDLELAAVMGEREPLSS
jgi:hypothetical protein